jgi:hypothetical protein
MSCQRWLTVIQCKDLIEEKKIVSRQITKKFSSGTCLKNFK